MATLMGVIKARLDSLAGYARWTEIVVGEYTATPPDVDQITMVGDYSTTIAAGWPVRYTYNGSVYYGIIKAITSNSLTVIGSPLATGHDVTKLEYGRPEMVKTVLLATGIPQYNVIGGGIGPIYSTGMSLTTEMITDCGGVPVRWSGPAAHVVGFASAHGFGTYSLGPKINLLVDGNRVGDDGIGGTDGIQMKTAKEDWVANSDVEINATNATVADGDVLEVEVTVIGTEGSSDKPRAISVLVTLVVE